MKGYYLIYGIFSNELEKIVKDLEYDLDIQLIKQGARDDLENEIYFLESNPERLITHFSIIEGNSCYHLTGDEIVKPNFLVSCNITSEKDEKTKEKYLHYLRNVLGKKDYLKELNFDVDEW